METTVTQNEPRATGVKVIVYNKSAFPARALTSRHVPLLLHPGRHAAPIERQRPATPRAARRRPTAKQYSGDIWYVEVDCTGYTITPAGQSAHRMEVQFKVGVAEGGTWNPANDPSYQAAAGPNPGVTLYDGTTRVWGTEPTGPSPSPSPSASPSPSPSRPRQPVAVGDPVGVAVAVGVASARRRR